MTLVSTEIIRTYTVSHGSIQGSAVIAFKDEAFSYCRVPFSKDDDCGRDGWEVLHMIHERIEELEEEN
jgi:hypothetical protein